MDIRDFTPLVRIIAQRVQQPTPPAIMLDDFIRNGMIGLIQAFREHKTSSRIPFKSFVCNNIQRAILDGLNASDWAERAVCGRANKLARATEDLLAQLQRKPTMKEIADALGIRVDDVATILGDAGNRMQVAPDSCTASSSIVERREPHSPAVAGLKTLQPNERRAFILRAMCEMSGREAALEMQVSESRVSQLYKVASGKLANYVSRPRYTAH